MYIQAVEDLCMHKFGGCVYDGLSLECESHITKQVDRYKQSQFLWHAYGYLFAYKCEC
jgi:hypothetical protein